MLLFGLSQFHTFQWRSFCFLSRLFSVLLLLLSDVSQSLSPDVVEILNQNAYGCWKGLGGSLWHIAGAGVEASEPLLLSVSAMPPLYWQASPQRISPFVCLEMPRADSWRAHMTSFGALHGPDWWTIYWEGAGADSLSKHTLVAGLLSQSWVTGDCSLPLCSLFLWVMMGPFGFSTGQRATTVSPEIWLHSYVPRDCFLTSNELSGLCLSWNDEMCIFFETIIESKHKEDELNLPRDLPTDQKGHRQQQRSQASVNQFSRHLHDFGSCCSFRKFISAQGTGCLSDTSFKKTTLIRVLISTIWLPWFIGGFCKPVCWRRSH